MYGHNKVVPLETLTVCREDTPVYNENILCRGYCERESDASTEYRVGEDGRDSRRKGMKKVFRQS